MLELVFHQDIRDPVVLWKDKVAKKSGLLDIYDIVAGLEIMGIRADNPRFQEFKSLMEVEAEKKDLQAIKEFIDTVARTTTKTDIPVGIDPRQLSTPDEFISYMWKKYNP